MHYKEQIDFNRIPQHVAIIMDGNGRWAKQRGKQRCHGHQAGAETVHIIAEEAARIEAERLATEEAARIEAEQLAEKEAAFVSQIHELSDHLARAKNLSDIFAICAVAGFLIVIALLIYIIKSKKQAK